MLIAASPCGHERHTLSGEYIDKALLASGHRAQLFKRACDNVGSNIVLAWNKYKAIQCLDHLSVKIFTAELQCRQAFARFKC